LSGYPDRGEFFYPPKKIRHKLLGERAIGGKDFAGDDRAGTADEKQLPDLVKSFSCAILKTLGKHRACLKTDYLSGYPDRLGVRNEFRPRRFGICNPSADQPQRSREGKA
jgi:hypothetical protein